MSMSRRALLTRSGGVIGSALLGSAAVSAATTPAVANPMSRSPRPRVRLIANENPYGLSPAARRAMENAADDSWQYSFADEVRLKALIAEREDLSPRHVMIGAGSGEILRIAALVYAGQNSQVIAAHPTFSFLPDYARTLGAQVVEVPLTAEMFHDLDAMARAIGDDTRLMYVCNPNNPTGTFVPGDQLNPFLADVAPRVPVLVDEAYLDLWDDWPTQSAVARVAAGDDVIVTRTFSKLHAMAGLRIGYALARPEIIGRLQQYRMSILNLPGLRAAVASYQDMEYQALSRQRIHQGLALTRGLLDDLGLAYAPSRGNFIFFDTGGSLKAFRDAMGAAGFMVGRPFPPYDSWCRVSMGRVEDMETFAGAARDWFQNAAA